MGESMGLLLESYSEAIILTDFSLITSAETSNFSPAAEIKEIERIEITINDRIKPAFFMLLEDMRSI